MQSRRGLLGALVDAGLCAAVGSSCCLQPAQSKRRFTDLRGRGASVIAMRCLRLAGSKLSVKVLRRVAPGKTRPRSPRREAELAPCWLGFPLVAKECSFPAGRNANAPS